jgi:uncharacterized protein (TIGR02600 family)
MKRRRRGEAGFALIVTLIALAVMAVLLLALLHGASGQLQSAESDAVVAREKMLADSAVALVIGQIAQASTQPGQAWISQPGLIRTYDASGTRQPTASYKLYSAATLVDTSGNLNFLAGDVPSNWNTTTNQNLYTDLNQPQITPGLFGTAIYPILDPAALTNVQGISSDAPHAVEMPVMWLYELQDGTFGPAANATAANPIVGRVAFWTDDETSKIDINTAGAGDTWNTPRANSTDDAAWSTTQPAAGEFSRYPGHPAMTSLAPVFGQGSLALSAQQMLGLTPRYGFGGSEFGALATTPGETVPPKSDRLYASVDELAFGTAISGGLRQPAALSPTQIDQARFVLTAHSEAPETTLLGEPRFAIWPVSDTPLDNTRTTPCDRTMAAAATIGARDYFFQRHSALDGSDLSGSTTAAQSNAQLFSDLVTRGGVKLPGYGAMFTQKYAGAKWSQLMLELVDFMRGLNAVDPSPAPFVPFAGGGQTHLGCAYIVPLTATDPATSAALRGLGRCPTLSSLTLVIYVCGFQFDGGTKNASVLDFTAAPDDLAGTTWKANFDLSSAGNRWSHVTGELLRAFVVPVTFHPGCGFPEVSDDCALKISGLDGIRIATVDGAASGDFGFSANAVSPLLGAPLQTLAADRAWGGNEGPRAWRLAGDAAAGGGAANYPFAGTKAFTLPLASAPQYNAATKTLAWPTPLSVPISITGGSALTVTIQDANGNALQTLNAGLPNFTVAAPTIQDEADHRDGATPATADANWAADSVTQVAPSYYMSFQNRLLATQGNRPLMIQPGDVTRAVEAATDLRVIAALPKVTSSFFEETLAASYKSQAVAHAHSFRFADGTSAYGASGANGLVNLAAYPSVKAAAVTGTDWSTGQPGAALPDSWFTSAACSAPTGGKFVTMMPTQNIAGDWDTGPGFAPDGAMINLPDAGTSLDPKSAYFSLGPGQIGAPTRFAPNALLPSPVIFGSLPAGIDPVTPANSEPWRTLLFCPYPAADTAHPGFAAPPDYLVLDNFWMPVVEPYALSTPMATAGKINLNNQIAPFTWLHRNTALHALLHDLRIPAIPVNMANPYKTAGPPIASIWQPVDEDATIAQIESRFASGDAYLAESEICAVPLVPQGVAAGNLDAFWNGAQGAGRLTGDNLRELPYAQLYGRLTTRSNSYTVHLRVQVLQKLARDPQQNVWKEGTDVVLGDWRGSYEIERDLDPAATAPAPGQPLGPYRFRIVSERRFAP